jgi:NOL1/NOP2/fmu family ribosome biogenesis protein
MASHDGYDLVEIPKAAGVEGGRPEWADQYMNAEGEGCSVFDTSAVRNKLTRAARLWPHRLRGEGHFVAKLAKKGAAIDDEKVRTVPEAEKVEGVSKCKNVRTVPEVEKVRSVPIEETVAYEDLPEEFRRFVEENLNYLPDGVFLLKGRSLYHLPEAPPMLAGLRTAKFGWFLGTFEGSRFEPSHSFVTALEKDAFKRAIDLSSDSKEIRSYLKGETLMLDGEKGLTAVCVDGITLGWAKQTGDMLKNMYPKGWRRLA